MLKRILRSIRQHQLTIPLVSMTLVTVAYFLLPLLSYKLTSLTTIGPCIGVIAVWIGLSAAPGKGRIAVLAASLAWMFVLWYAFPSPMDLLATTGGVRTVHLALATCYLSRDDLNLLVENHCLLTLKLESCSWEGDLAPLSKLPHLRHLTLSNLKVSAADVDAIASCQSLEFLELGDVIGAQWNRWPKNLAEISLTLGASTQSRWRFADMPSLGSLVFQNQEGPDWGEPPAEFINRDPIRLEFQNCASVLLHIDSDLPVHLGLLKTPVLSLRSFLGIRGTRTQAKPLVDLRSFRCDGLSMLKFSARVADCETFTLSLLGNSSASSAVVNLDGLRSPQTPSRFSLYSRKLSPLSDRVKSNSGHRIDGNSARFATEELHGDQDRRDTGNSKRDGNLEGRIIQIEQPGAHRPIARNSR